MEKTTPVMQQYLDIKARHKHNLVFFRLGDFYELFYDDAVVASRILSIALTSRSGDDKIPMCGVPYHSVDSYIAKLIENGLSVAICEQLEDPKLTKTIVKRDVVRVITPGTVLDTNALDEKSNNYILSIFQELAEYGIAICDLTTGKFLTTQMNDKKKLYDEIAKYNPAEIIANESFIFKEEAENIFSKRINTFHEWSYSFKNAKKCIGRHFGTMGIDGLGLSDKNFCVCASGALLEYLYETQKDIKQITAINVYSLESFMAIDSSSRRNLELIYSMRDRAVKGTLLWVLDHTQTAMGARLLKSYIQQPLLSVEEINRRLDCVSEIQNDVFLGEELKELLNTVYDLERLMTKVMYQTANGRDLTAMKNSLKHLPDIQFLLSKLNSAIFVEIFNKLDICEDLYALIDASIKEDCPVNVRDGDMIKKGYNAELDELVEIKSNVKQLLERLEEEEREKTGIKNLKIKYNKIFGFYIEVTNSYLRLVPDYYQRRQTMANGERFTTQRLKEIEDSYLGADEKISTLEQSLFRDVLNKLSLEQSRVQACADCLAIIDVFRSLAYAASLNSYCRPIVNDGGVIDIKDCRHPVIENLTEHAFIPNDVYLNQGDDRLSVITGPNMAGKSTYMRSVALSVLMAQIGSFVPASSATIGIVDKIFTRVGASDDLATGQSTFMVEMTEVANILNTATKRSLIILDEIGRGTSTFDGLSIAWAVMEHIADEKSLGARTLFATHYHELSELEDKVYGVNSYHFTVSQSGEDIIFLRKLTRGRSDNSYGIHVAKLAGIPNKVLKRSFEILNALNRADVVSSGNNGDVLYEKKKIKNQEIIIRTLREDS